MLERAGVREQKAAIQEAVRGGEDWSSVGRREQLRRITRCVCVFVCLFGGGVGARVSCVVFASEMACGVFAVSMLVVRACEVLEMLRCGCESDCKGCEVERGLDDVESDEDEWNADTNDNASCGD